MSANDLSEYERIRLENIKRNAEFLASLGLGKLQNSISTKTVEEVKKKRTSSDISKDPMNRLKKEFPTRMSKRLQKISEDAVTEASVVNSEVNPQVDEAIDYENMPLDSSELDDFEFEVYTHLKAWRLQKCRELEIEPYKICQNRTLAELIRIRRNDSDWANSLRKSVDDKEKDLLQCWGIGPSKAKEGGYGFDMIDVIDKSQELLDILEKSRSIAATSY